MTDEILIVENTIEEITIEEFSGAPTGTIITSTHGMDKGDQHTIRDIVGLTTKLHDIEKLHQVRSNLGGHADYYLWGEEATEDNPLGPGYFVRLGEDGKIHKCTNETVILRPTDLTLDKDEQGQVIIYALAGNIATADINKYYVVGTQVPYDIYAYDGVEYVKKSAYSYDGEKVVKTCHTTDALGVTVSSAGFVGNDENITGTYTSAKAADVGYALVATTGVVDVLCDHSILVGDYVFPTVGGWAAKSTGSYGYLVTALVPSVNDTLYARIVLSPSMVNAKRVSDNVDYLLAETQRIGENVVKAVSDAQTALDEVRDSGNNLSDRVNNFESSMNAMGEQLYTNTVAVGNANSRAAEAERVANQAKEYVDEVVATTGGDAASALADASYAKSEVEKLSQSMSPITNYTNEQGEVVGAYGIVNKQDELGGVVADIQTWREDDVSGYAATVKRVSATENSISELTAFESDITDTVAQIKQKSDENGSSITALTSKIDKYSVGEYSQAYGLTQAQAADILEAGKIVFIPTDFASKEADASFTEIYTPIVVETWTAVDKNTKYIYSDSTYYYYHNGSQWVSTSISDGQTSGYCVTRFTEHYSYVWDGKKWAPETGAINVYFTNDAPTGMNSISPLYWVVGSGCTDDQYKIGALYVYDNGWKEVALGTSNSMSRVTALVEQTQNSWQTAISNVKGDMAALSAKVDENGSNVAMVASVVKEVDGVNLDFADNTEKTPYASKDDIVSTDKTKYFVVGTKTPYDIYYYDGTTYIPKINWSYDGQRVLQPNTASIVTSANEDTSGIKLSASHIKFEGENYTVNAGNIDFTGDDYKINADRIELAGSTTFSNYAQLEDVIKEQKVEYTKSTSNITLEGEVVWSSDYPIRDSGEYIWRKTTIIKGNDTELTPIIECITPADGKDGTSVAIKGTADSITQQGDLWQITYNGNIVIDAVLGDGYVYDGDLYVCVQVIDGVDLFSNVGQIQGPQGISGASLQIIYKAQDTPPDTPTGANPTGWSPNMPTSGVIYMSQKLSNATVWSNPVRISGEKGEPGSDGVGAKYVYYLIPKDGTLPTKPIFENGALVTTTGWTEKPSGVTEQRQYEYVSVSTETEKVGDNESIQNWINFSDPVVWSKWGEKGQDGDGVEYLYCLQADSTNPPTITINYGDEPTSPWTDEPTGTSEDKPYEYVVQIKSTDTKDSTYTGKLWGVYDGMIALYCASTGTPIKPEGKGSVASSSENTTWQTNIPAVTGTQSVWVSYKTFLGKNWSTPIKASAKDGPTGATIRSIETYYLVTKTDGAPTDAESGVVEGSGSWNTAIENWGKKVDGDIYQYLWVREKMTMNDANSTVIWTDPRLDASMTTIGNWCTENNKTLINGGNIATGSITAQQMAADAIKSFNYKPVVEISDAIWDTTNKDTNTIYYVTYENANVYYTYDDTGGWSTTGLLDNPQQGTFLNLEDGAIDSKNFKVDSAGVITATQGVIGGWEISEDRIGNDVVGMHSGDDNVYKSLVVDNDTSPVRFYAGSSFQTKTVVETTTTTTSPETFTYSPEDCETILEATYSYTNGGGGGSFSGINTNTLTFIWNGSIGATLTITYTYRVRHSFIVLEDGSLYASDANITGAINTNKGRIGGWQIGENDLIHDFKQVGGDGQIRFAVSEDSSQTGLFVVHDTNLESQDGYHYIKLFPSDFDRIVYEEEATNGDFITSFTYMPKEQYAGYVCAENTTVNMVYSEENDSADLTQKLYFYEGQTQASIVIGSSSSISDSTWGKYDQGYVRYRKRNTKQAVTKITGDGLISAQRGQFAQLFATNNDLCFNLQGESIEGIPIGIRVKYEVKEENVRYDWTFTLMDETLENELNTNLITSPISLSATLDRRGLGLKGDQVIALGPINFPVGVNEQTVSRGSNENIGKLIVTLNSVSTTLKGSGQHSNPDTVFPWSGKIGQIYVGSTSAVISNKSLVPGATGLNLGSTSHQWENVHAKDVFTHDGGVHTSDRNLKTNIAPLNDTHSALFDKLQPVSFQFVDGENGRTHTGLIAQEVKEAVEDVGLTTQDFAAYCEWEQKDGTTTCGLRYSEFIALCIDQIQKLKARTTEQENIINNLTNRLTALEEKSK